MVDLNNVGQKITSLRADLFPMFMKKGREVSLENPFSISFSEVAPDEVAVFCRIARDWIILVYVHSEGQFDYQKQMNDALLIIPKNTTVSGQFESRRTIVERAKHRGTEYWWQKGAFA
jgi:hypothetical protein